MNRNLSGRLDRLHIAKGGDQLPANVRRWLGQPILPAEHEEADRLDAMPPYLRNDAEWSKLPRDTREWLGEKA